MISRPALPIFWTFGNALPKIDVCRDDTVPCVVGGISRMSRIGGRMETRELLRDLILSIAAAHTLMETQARHLSHLLERMPLSSEDAADLEKMARSVGLKSSEGTVNGGRPVRCGERMTVRWATGSEKGTETVFDCILEHGHEGLHHSSLGTHWTEEPSREVIQTRG